MSEKIRDELLMVKDAKLYGIYRLPLYHEEYLYYFQNLFVRGEVEENLPFIKICSGTYPKYIIRNENNNFLLNILNIVNSNNLTDYDKTKEYDSEKFLLHGANVKILIFCGEIVAIGNINEDYWIPTANFFTKINDIQNFKKELVEKKIIECQEEYYAHLCSRFNDWEKYLNNRNILKRLRESKKNLG